MGQGLKASMATDLDAGPTQRGEGRNVVRFDMGDEIKTDDAFFASGLNSGKSRREIRPRMVQSAMDYHKQVFFFQDNDYFEA